MTIAKVDATANDVPEDISGFPTIKLYAAGAKDSPVDYRGSRTIEDLANFVRDNGKHQVDAYVEEEASEEKPEAESESSSSSAEAAADTDSASESKGDEDTRHEEL